MIKLLKWKKIFIDFSYSMFKDFSLGLSYFQDKAAHFELLEQADFIFYNVTDGLKAMDKIRLQIYDPKTPLSIGPIPKRYCKKSSIKNKAWSKIESAHKTWTLMKIHRFILPLLLAS